MNTTTVLYITQTLTVCLLIWSEYLGVSPNTESNALLHLLCGLDRGGNSTPLSHTL